MTPAFCKNGHPLTRDNISMQKGGDGRYGITCRDPEDRMQDSVNAMLHRIGWHNPGNWRGTMVRVYASRFTPDVRGGDIDWKIGETATYKTTEGWPVPVEIVSDHVSHAGAPEARQCREVIFPDGFILPNGEVMPGGKFCVDADRLTPIFTDDEKAAVEWFRRRRDD